MLGWIMLDIKSEDCDEDEFNGSGGKVGNAKCSSEFRWNALGLIVGHSCVFGDDVGVGGIIGGGGVIIILALAVTPSLLSLLVSTPESAMPLPWSASSIDCAGLRYCLILRFFIVSCGLAIYCLFLVRIKKKYQKTLQPSIKENWICFVYFVFSSLFRFLVYSIYSFCFFHHSHSNNR